MKTNLMKKVNIIIIHLKNKQLVKIKIIFSKLMLIIKLFKNNKNINFKKHQIIIKILFLKEQINQFKTLFAKVLFHITHKIHKLIMKMNMNMKMYM